MERAVLHLNPIPNLTATSGTFTPVAINRLVVADLLWPTIPDAAESDTKNYTVIQTRGTPGTLSTYLLYADVMLRSSATARRPGDH